MASIEQANARAGQISHGARHLLIYAFLTAISSGLSSFAHAQTFAEWFKQKKTQKKYLLEQIAALKAFSGFARKGYQIAHGGLSGISGSLKNEFNMHTNYYQSLAMVNPAVGHNLQVKEIITWQKDILDKVADLPQIEGLTNEERYYVSTVKAALLKDCELQMAELQQAITDTKLKMSDAERLKLIGRVHEEMDSNYRFACNFSDQAKLLAFQRRRQQLDNWAGKQNYGVTK